MADCRVPKPQPLTPKPQTVGLRAFSGGLGFRSFRLLSGFGLRFPPGSGFRGLGVEGLRGSGVQGFRGLGFRV